MWELKLENFKHALVLLDHISVANELLLQEGEEQIMLYVKHKGNSANVDELL